MTSFLGWSPEAWLVVNALAVYRLSRLVARDELLRPARRWITDRYEGTLVYLLTCIWCLSFTVFGVGAVLLTHFLPYLWSFVAAGLAFSAVAGHLSERA